MPRKKEHYPKIKVVELKNKTRTGKYVYVKMGKGGHSKYYKYDENLGLEDYLTIAQSKIKYTKGGVSKALQTPTYLHERIKRKKTIDALLKRGVSQAHLNNALTLSSKQLNERIRTLLRERVHDEGIIEILLQESNMQKLKKRFGYEAILLGKNGEELATLTNYEKITPKQALKELRFGVKTGEEVVDNYPRIADRLKKAGWKYNHKINGVVYSVKLHIVFRKG